MEAIDWHVLDRIVQWLILPAIAWLWALQRASGEIDRKMLRLEGEIARMLTVLEERDRRRAEDRAEMAEAIRELKASIATLTAKIDAWQPSRARKEATA